MTDWKPHAHHLTEELAEARILTDPQWRAAFENIPRHVFVPSFLGQDGTQVSGGDANNRDQWLTAVYSDTSLTTQTAVAPGTDIEWPTSSSTMPSLMARMLELLAAVDGRRVLEIGTGTGYNAALLCHRLGDDNVASIDIDPELVAAARTRLRQLGYDPFLVAGDGAAGIPQGAPYDRILATCAVPTVPPAWITQLADGGLIVADVRGEIASSLVVLHKIDPETVRGRFLPVAGHFMWMRTDHANPLRDGGTYRTAWNLDGATERTTALHPAALDDPDLRFVLQCYLPDAQGLYQSQTQGEPTWQLHADDGSWAQVSIDHGRVHVTEAGPRPLWELAERATQTWETEGRPARSRFGLTAAVNGQHQLWLDDPSHTIPLPDTPS